MAGNGVDMTHFRRSSLLAEGIRSATSASFLGRGDSRSSAAATAAALRRRAAASSAASARGTKVAVARLNLRNGWIRRGGRGTFHSLGAHVQVEGGKPGSGLAVHTFQPHSSDQGAHVSECLQQGGYNLAVTVKVPKASRALHTDEQRGFAIVFGYVDARHFFTLSANLLTHVWAIERYGGGGGVGGPTCVQSHYQPPTRRKGGTTGAPTRFRLLLQVRGDAITVDVNNTPFFTSVRHSAGLSLGGTVGVAACGGQQFRVCEFAVFPPQVAYEPPRAPPPGVAGSTPSRPSARSFVTGAMRGSGLGSPSPSRRPHRTPRSPSVVQAAGIGKKVWAKRAAASAAAASTLSSPPAPQPSPYYSPPVPPGRRHAMPSRSPPAPPPVPSAAHGGGPKRLSPTVRAAATASALHNGRRSPSASPTQGAYRRLITASAVVDGAGGKPVPASAGARAGAGVGAGAGAGAAVGAGAGAGMLDEHRTDGEGAQGSRLHHSALAAAASSMPRGDMDMQVPRYMGDDEALVEAIERDIIAHELDVTFDDIAALDDAKRLLNEAVALPLLVPEFFTGIRKPWKGVLLFGPPGTGKTMLAKAVASMNNVTFFNASAASLVSRYHGESEKLVRCLFGMARHYSPSIIFIDEIDSLLSSRGGATEHEASRRLKTEFLVEMDGVESSREDGGIVVVMATTNAPWLLDEALCRRLEKRIYIPLPDEEARAELFELHLQGVPTGPDVNIDAFASMTEGYSGADIQLLCREASMVGMRRLLAGKTPADIVAMRAAGLLSAPQVSGMDILAAMKTTSPSVSASDLERYKAWAMEKGST